MCTGTILCEYFMYGRKEVNLIVQQADSSKERQIRNVNLIYSKIDNQL